MGRDDVFSYLDQGPFCVVAVDPTSGRAIQTNSKFTNLVGPLFKFAEYAFWDAATEGPSRDQLRQAIENVRDGLQDSVSARQVEILTLCGAIGMPKNRFFDWTVGKGPDGTVMLFGNPDTTNVSKTGTCGLPCGQKFDESEFVDFFQNAPIALHWLDNNGTILWANQTELDVLGYTAEEYIGKPLTNFCPDEKDVVLEILKQLISGNSIKDVPARFRTKDGRIVYLLIDSNVKYVTDANGIRKFGHTRCFIRDDTKRMIREAHTQTLLEETKRSLQMLDNFMSRSIHHMRTPLHMLQNTCELVTELLQKVPAADGSSVIESIALLREAETQIGEAVGLADDLVLLGRLDQGAELELDKTVVDLATLGEEIHSDTSSAMGSLTVEISGGGGPSKIHSDPTVLRRVLSALLDHAMTGKPNLQIEYQNGLCTFQVMYNDKEAHPCNPSKGELSGKLPPIFQRFHQNFIPEGVVEFEAARSFREDIEHHVNSFKESHIGIGLSLAYFLVQGLGSELRYSAEQNGTAKFWFSLPKEDLPTGYENCVELACLRLVSHGAETGPTQTIPEKSVFVSPSPKGLAIAVQDKVCAKSLPVVPSLRLKGETPVALDVPKSKLASKGLVSMDTPHVLIVEDTDMCAKLLKMSLSKLNCLSTTVENGRLAVELLQKAAPGDYNLVLMDLRMPIMDGLEATKVLKQELKLSVPVVALTAESNATIEAECRAIGFDDFRTKPLKRDQLKEILFKHTGYHLI